MEAAGKPHVAGHYQHSSRDTPHSGHYCTQSPGTTVMEQGYLKTKFRPRHTYRLAQDTAIPPSWATTNNLSVNHMSCSWILQTISRTGLSKKEEKGNDNGESFEQDQDKGMLPFRRLEYPL